MNQPLKNKFDSIIFDLDGTLWDSTQNVVYAWQAAINEVDFLKVVMTREKVRSITGLAYNVIFDMLFPELDPVQRNEVMELCAKHEISFLQKNGGILYPNLENTLIYLAQKYRLFIVSNCQNGYIELFLEFSKFGKYFIGHQCYGTKGLPKADNIKDIVIDYNLQAPVYIGDTLGDYNSATKAGVPFIFANYGFGKVETGQTASINSLVELCELL
jgi:phosphoglycolate phosphatase